MPTESVELGHTLWISALWFLCWTISAWLRWREQDRVSVSWTGLDLAVCCFIGGHLISGSMILLDTGDKRAALNLMWEWASLAVMYVALKRILKSADGRQAVLSALIITGIALSGLGVWQHFFWYRSQAAEVTELLELHDRQSSTSLSAPEIQRYQTLSTKHGTNILTLDNTGRQMFLARVGASVEPIGRFVLANTLGGLLACLCTLFVASMIERFRTTSPLQLIVSLSATGLLLTCLLLTKSRTGMLGLFVGLGIFLMQKLFVQTLSKAAIKQGGMALVVVLLLVTTLFFTGSLDLEVLLEAGKSMQYRVQYWVATFAMLQDSPVFGVGPGNFRQHYLQFKLPGSSEEINDPHNLLLDVWANGGMLSLIGLIGIFSLHSWFRIFKNKNERVASSTEHQNSEDEHEQPVAQLSLLSIGALTGGIVLGYEYLILGITDTIMLWTWVGWMAIAFIFSNSRVTISTTSLIALCVFIALSSNLLAAGGIGMPAITQLFLILSLLDRSSVSLVKTVTVPTAVPMAISVLCLVSQVWTSLVPNILVTNLLETGQYEMVIRHQSQRAIQTFTRATLLDSLHPEPWQQLAAANFTRWIETGQRDAELFSDAILAQQAAIQRDPHSPNRHRSLGEFWLAKYQRTSNLEDARHAVEAFQKSASLYPGSSMILSQLAITQGAFKQDENILKHAVQNAQRALELDDLNTQLGHSDKVLPADTRQQVLNIVDKK